jgi:hypothetical protein
VWWARPGRPKLHGYTQDQGNCKLRSWCSMAARMYDKSNFAGYTPLPIADDKQYMTASTAHDCINCLHPPPPLKKAPAPAPLPTPLKTKQTNNFSSVHISPTCVVTSHI